MPNFSLRGIDENVSQALKNQAACAGISGVQYKKVTLIKQPAASL